MKRSSYPVVGLLMAAVLVASGCGKLKQSNRLPELTSVRFQPPGVMPGETVVIIVSATDKDNDKFEIEYEWQVDGKKVAGTTNQLSTVGLAAGAKVTARYRLKELPSGNLTDWEEKTIELGAPAPEEIKGVNIEPESLTVGQTARAVIDYGEVSAGSVTFYYQWTINGQTPEGDEYREEELDARHLKQGDQVQVTVSDDEEFNGMSWKSPTLTVVGNPPVFSTEPYMEVKDRVVFIKYEVEDPDGDPVAITFTGAPAGASQGKNQIKINADGAAPGDYNIVITATDPSGGYATYDMVLTIPESEKGTKPGNPDLEPPAEQPVEEPAVVEPPSEPPMEQSVEEPAEGEEPAEQPVEPAPGGSE